MLLLADTEGGWEALLSDVDHRAGDSHSGEQCHPPYTCRPQGPGGLLQPLVTGRNPSLSQYEFPELVGTAPLTGTCLDFYCHF